MRGLQTAQRQYCTPVQIYAGGLKWHHWRVRQVQGGERRGRDWNARVGGVLVWAIKFFRVRVSSAGADGLAWAGPRVCRQDMEGLDFGSHGDCVTGEFAPLREKSCSGVLGGCAGQTGATHMSRCHGGVGAFGSDVVQTILELYFAILESQWPASLLTCVPSSLSSTPRWWRSLVFHS